MHSSAGQNSLGWLLGEGESRGIALVFVLAGVVGLVVTVLALASPYYRTLSRTYADAPEQPVADEVPPEGAGPVDPRGRTTP